MKAIVFSIVGAFYYIFAILVIEFVPNPTVPVVSLSFISLVFFYHAGKYSKEKK